LFELIFILAPLFPFQWLKRNYVHLVKTRMKFSLTSLAQSANKRKIVLHNDDDYNDDHHEVDDDIMMENRMFR
jgi:hypothetical protein